MLLQVAVGSRKSHSYNSIHLLGTVYLCGFLGAGHPRLSWLLGYRGKIALMRVLLYFYFTDDVMNRNLAKLFIGNDFQL